MNKQTLIGIVLVIVVAGIVFKTRHNSISGVAEDAEIAKESISDQGLAMAQVGVPKSEGQSSVSEAREKELSATAVGPPHAEELKQYRVIKNKAFLTDEEKALRKSFLENNEMLRNLGTYLKTPATEESDSEEAKNAATDLLLEAIKDEKSAAAEAALQEVIADNTIENTQMDPAQRESLAGVKAEILYHWSAIDPEKVSQIEEWLPGPVSKKIWQNVLKAQNQNRAESHNETFKSLSK